MRWYYILFGLILMAIFITATTYVGDDQVTTSNTLKVGLTNISSSDVNTTNLNADVFNGTNGTFSNLISIGTGSDNTTIEGGNITANRIKISKNYSGSSWEYSSGSSVYNRPVYLNLSNVMDRVGQIGNTFLQAFQIDINNYGDAIKPIGIGIGIDQYSQDANADTSGIILDINLKEGNSTLKGLQTHLRDNSKYSAGIRGVYNRINKDNSSTIAYNSLVTSEGSKPIDAALYATGGGGFINGILLDSNGEFINGLNLRAVSSGGNAIMTRGNWQNEFFCNTTGICKIRSDEVLEFTSERNTSGGAIRFQTQNSSNHMLNRVQITSGDQAYVYFGSANDLVSIKMYSPDKSESTCSLTNDDLISCNGVTPLNSSLPATFLNVTIGDSTSNTTISNGLISTENITATRLNLTGTAMIQDNLTMGDGSKQVNITLTSPDGTEGCCGLNDDLTFTCREGAC